MALMGFLPIALAEPGMVVRAAPAVLRRAVAAAVAAMAVAVAVPVLLPIPQAVLEAPVAARAQAAQAATVAMSLPLPLPGASPGPQLRRAVSEASVALAEPVVTARAVMAGQEAQAPA